jgi:hypothetical protein
MEKYPRGTPRHSRGNKIGLIGNPDLTFRREGLPVSGSYVISMRVLRIPGESDVRRVLIEKLYTSARRLKDGSAVLARPSRDPMARALLRK